MSADIPDDWRAFSRLRADWPDLYGALLGDWAVGKSVEAIRAGFPRLPVEVRPVMEAALRWLETDD